MGLRGVVLDSVAGPEAAMSDAGPPADTPPGSLLMYQVDVVSHLREEHLARLPALVREATRADGHEPLGEHKFLRLQHGDDLARAILAFERAELAGYAHTLIYGDAEVRRASCEMVVRPAARRRGVGRMLLSHAIVNARACGARRLDLWAYNDSGTSGHIAAQFGFRPVRRLLHLHRHVRAVPAAPAAQGVIVRSIRPEGDAEAWIALNAQVFASHPEQGRWTLADLRARIAQPWFDRDDFLVAERGGRMIGFNWLKVEERPDEGRVGEIYVIGVAEDERGRGIGELLVARGLARLREREVDVAAIYVDESNTGALRLYEAAGFHYHHVDVCYALDLAEDGANVSETAA